MFPPGPNHRSYVKQVLSGISIWQYHFIPTLVPQVYYTQITWAFLLENIFENISPAAGIEPPTVGTETIEAAP